MAQCILATVDLLAPVFIFKISLVVFQCSSLKLHVDPNAK